MKIEIVENGNLKLSIDSIEKEENQYSKDYYLESVVYDLFEPYSCNGSYTLFDAGNGNPFVGLTDAPCIAESMDIDDDGNQTIIGRFWAYLDYQIKCPFQELFTKGEVIFSLVS